MKALLVVPPFPPATLTNYGNVMNWLGKKAAEPNLGIITVAALLKNSWDLKVLDLAFQELSDEDRRHADLLFVTGLTIQESEILSLIREGKRHGMTVVVGGPWAFHAAQRALAAGADLVIVGEAECAREEMIDRLDTGRLRHILKSEVRADLADSPPPRWDLLEMGSYLSMPVQYGRGCPFHCEFCDVTVMMGREVRCKAPEQMLRELTILHDLGWRGMVAFVDDNFIGKPTRAKELLRKLVPWMREREYPFSFETQVSINLAADEELLELMAGAGFSKVCVGIESLEPHSLKLTGKYQNLSVDPLNACRRIGKAGIQNKATFIIGLDGEASGVDRRVIDFARKAGMPDPLLQPLVAYEGTALRQRLDAEARLLPDRDSSLGSTGGLPNFLPQRPIQEIAAELVHFSDVVYRPEFCMEQAYEQVAGLGTSPRRNVLRTDPLLFLRTTAFVVYNRGMRNSPRWKFWKLFTATLIRFPSRLYQFLSYLAFAEHHYAYRGNVHAEVAAALTRWPASDVSEDACAKTPS